MNKSRLTPLEVVERYHEKYLQYESAFNKNPYSEKERQEDVVKLAKSGIDLDSQEFLEKITDLMIDKAHKMADVNNAAFKFVMFTDFYLLTQEEDLPKNIIKDYDSLPIKESIKPHFSIKDGDFVRNEDLVLDKETKDYFKALIKQIKEQI